MAHSISPGQQWQPVDGDAAVGKALYELAQELRTFVTNLKMPAAGQRHWMLTVRQRCQEMSERVERFDLRERWNAVSPALGRLRGALQAHADALSESCTLPRVRQMRAALANSYEELRAQLLDSRLLRDRAWSLPTLRLPKVARSLFHAAMGLTAVLLHQLVFAQRTSLIVLGILLSLFSALELAKRSGTAINHFLVDRVFGAISRPDERYRVNSAIYYVIAMFLVAWLAPKPAACAAVLVLAFGDPVASFVGSRWAKRRLARGKSLLGSIAFVGAAFIATAIYLLSAVPTLGTSAALGTALSVSLAGAATELLSGPVDDNLTIPIVCAATAVLWL